MPIVTPRQHRQMVEALDSLEAAYTAFAQVRANSIAGNDDLVDAACARMHREPTCLRNLLLLRSPALYVVQE